MSIQPVFQSSLLQIHFGSGAARIRNDFFRIQPGNHYSYVCRSIFFASKPNLAVSAAVSTSDTLSRLQPTDIICVHFCVFI
jgi:hypothetical protein